MANVDKEAVRCSNPVERVIPELLNELPIEVGGELKVRCPWHEDKRPSLRINPAKRLWRCDPCNKGGDVFGFVQEFQHVDFREALTFLADRSGHTTGEPPRERRIVATYDYKDEHGEPLYQTVRYDPKNFRQRRPDGKGGWIWNLEGVPRVLYRLPDLKGREAVIVCEGEKDVETLREAGLPATCNVGGAGKWKDEYTQQLIVAGVQRVRIIPDRDAPGLEHAETVARSCVAAGLSKVRIVSLPLTEKGADVSDYLRTHTAAELRALLKKDAPEYEPALPAEAAPVDPTFEPVAPSGAAPVLIRMADVQPEAISWLWTGRLARGKITVLAGDPGVGKSFLTLDLAARMTTGRAWPDNEPATGSGDVILLAAEDGIADTMRPRLDAMGGDPRRVHVLQAIRMAGDGNERAFSLQTDLVHLEAAIQSTGASMVVIDPVSNYLGDVNTYRDNEVRQTLTPVALLAERTGVAVVLIMHLTKDTKTAALYRLNSSIAFGGVARIVLAVGTDPAEPNPYAPNVTRAMASIKQNICEPATPWAYRTIDNRVEWLGPREDIRPDTLLAGQTHHESEARQDVEAFLCRELADGRPHESAAVMAAADRAGISLSRLTRTRKQICDKPKRVGWGEGASWTWQLKPEYIAVPALLPPISSIHATGANNGGNTPLTSFDSTTSSLLALDANNEGPANNGANNDEDGFGEV